MTKDEIQFWMLIAFAIVFILSSYKIYIMFNAPADGIDTQVQYNQLEDIIIEYIQSIQEHDLDANTLFKSLKALDTLKDPSYKNFNQNRFNQLLQQLYLRYEVVSLEALIKNIHQPQSSTSKENEG